LRLQVGIGHSLQVGLTQIAQRKNSDNGDERTKTEQIDEDRLAATTA